MSNVVYVLFNKSAPHDGFMVGSHTGTLDELITKYINMIPNVMVKCFMETSEADSIVREFRVKHIKDRNLDCRGNLSDWFTMDFSEISASLVLLYCKYNNDQSTLIVYRTEESNSIVIETIEEPIVIETIEEPIPIIVETIDESQRHTPKKLDIFPVQSVEVPLINNCNLTVTERSNDPIKFISDRIDLFTIKTKGTQNVKVIDLCRFIREYRNDFSDESIKDIMKNLGHKIGIDPSDRRHLGYPRPGCERYMDLSWTHKIRDEFPVLCGSWETLPPPVIQKTVDYVQFIRDSIKPVLTSDGLPDNMAVVTLDELYNTFCKWYYDQEIRIKIPTKIEFKENYEKVTKCKGDAENKWYGLRLNTQSRTMSSLLDF